VCEPREETISELADDDAIVFEEFFTMGLHMPPHPALTEILIKFWVQLHQLTPNAFALLSKYFWAMMSFSSKPSSDGFAKCYELQYQPKKVTVIGFERFQQFGVLNFQARQGGGVRLTPTIENKWSTGLMKAGFCCMVPLHACPHGGKSVYAIWSHMSDLCFHTEPHFVCPDDDLSNGAFVWASKFIIGWNTVEGFVVSGVWPLGAGVSFDQVSVGVTPVLKLKVPLPKFAIAHGDGEDDIKFLVRVVQEARIVVGCYTHPEHEACLTGLHNNSHMNRVLELAGVAYGPYPVPGSDASTEASMKRKADAIGKAPLKHSKAPGRKRVETTKAATSL
jgi:hypothetical protein